MSELIENGVAEIAEGLFESPEPASDDDTDLGGDEPEIVASTPEPAAESAPAPAAEETPAAPVVKAPPQSWAKDKHEVWAKMPPEAQDYYMTREKQMLDGLESYKQHAGIGRQLTEVFTPYKAMLAAQGVDEVKATQVLMNAHYRLTTLSPQEKLAYFAELGRGYGIDLSALSTAQNTQPIDPTVKELQDKVVKLEGTLTQRQQAEREAEAVKWKSTVDTFAADPAHPYFDECADDIVALIQAGNTLEQAYDKAVYANPVTRAKELARLQTEQETKLRAEAEAKVAAARKARGTIVKGRDTNRTPTEPLGSMDDTMRETLKTIKERVH